MLRPHCACCSTANFLNSSTVAGKGSRPRPIIRSRIAGVASTLLTAALSVLTMADEEFLAFAEQRFGTRLGRWRKVGQRQLWPLHLKFAERVTDARIVVIGNAAQTIHPIGAQGFNLGLRDALALADVVAAHRADAGSVAALAEYAERRREDRERTTRFSDALVRFMASDLPIGPLRSLALLSAEHVPLLRHALVHASMGFR